MEKEDKKKEDEIEFEELENLVEPETEEKDFETFIKNNSAFGSRVSVSRWDNDTNSWAKVGDYSIKDFENSSDLIARKYGGGTYKFQIRDEKGKYVGQYTETFDKLAYPEKTPTPPNPFLFNQPVPQDTTNLNEIVSTMMKEMRENQNATIQQTKENQNLMLGLMSQIITGLMANSQKPQPSLLENPNLLRELKDLLGNESVKQNPMNDIKTLLSVLKAGIDLGSDIAEKHEPVESESVIELALKKLLAGKPSENPVISALDNVIKTEPQNTNSVKVGGNMSVSMIERLAKLNVPTKAVAKSLLNTLDDFTLNLLVEMKDDREQIKKFLIDMLPELAKYPEWSDKLIDDAIIELSKETNENISDK
ncbi:MAG: hypothetical protein GYA62_04160 [Bacteroidales bacterium]|nr:hypothetical protein [Bacteroidales bacterium]